MKLNSQTDFSLRLLMYLATKERRTATIQEASRQLGLSPTHMMRIAAKLAARGLVASTRGRLGGITLARDAGNITVEEVVRAMEPDFSLVQCFDRKKSQCMLEPGCLLKNVLSLAMSAFFAELGAVSLADITEPNHEPLTQIFLLQDSVNRPNLRRVPQMRTSLREVSAIGSVH